MALTYKSGVRTEGFVPVISTLVRDLAVRPDINAIVTSGVREYFVVDGKKMGSAHPKGEAIDVQPVTPSGVLNTMDACLELAQAIGPVTSCSVEVHRNRKSGGGPGNGYHVHIEVEPNRTDSIWVKEVTLAQNPDGTKRDKWTVVRTVAFDSRPRRAVELSTEVADPNVVVSRREAEEAADSDPFVKARTESALRARATSDHRRIDYADPVHRSMLAAASDASARADLFRIQTGLIHGQASAALARTNSTGGTPASVSPPKRALTADDIARNFDYLTDCLNGQVSPAAGLSSEVARVIGAGGGHQPADVAASGLLYGIGDRELPLLKSLLERQPLLGELALSGRQVAAENARVRAMEALTTSLRVTIEQREHGVRGTGAIRISAAHGTEVAKLPKVADVQSFASLLQDHAAALPAADGGLLVVYVDPGDYIGRSVVPLAGLAPGSGQSMKDGLALIAAGAKHVLSVSELASESWGDDSSVIPVAGGAIRLSGFSFFIDSAAMAAFWAKAVPELASVNIAFVLTGPSDRSYSYIRWAGTPQARSVTSSHDEYMAALQAWVDKAGLTKARVMTYTRAVSELNFIKAKRDDVTSSFYHVNASVTF